MRRWESVRKKNDKGRKVEKKEINLRSDIRTAFLIVLTEIII